MEEVEVVISVICEMWSWAYDGRSVLDMSFSVDSCVRKHAKVYGENRQQCFKVHVRAVQTLPDLISA